MLLGFFAWIECFLHGLSVFLHGLSVVTAET